MAVPKRRKSRARTRHRRAQWKAQAPQLVRIVVDGEVHQVPPYLVPAVRRGLVQVSRR
ncbi:50S ribosomal protein L32 [Speluncibacter jeojiensis]|uniref:Large ribosomal subunit protein bL32 n=1 Tax=Speluncibacter jeojiensis TaxID=2710754 RepID=A0A9X4M2C0_9ACTN|nr:50S ribosomal protein L32 [Corynebacteriales bacterium D3-21]